MPTVEAVLWVSYKTAYTIGM